MCYHVIHRGNGRLGVLGTSGDWLTLVDTPPSATQVEQLNESLQRGRAFGSSPWTTCTANRLDLHFTLRLPGF